VDAHVTGETLAFEGWHFDRKAHLLYRQDASGTWTPVPIGSRAQDILTLLLEQPGTLVSKDALLEAAWPNTAVEPNNLSVQIAALRRVLDRDRSDGSYIQTVSGRGYRFVAPEHSQAEALRLLHTRAINGNATDDVLCAEAGGDHIVTASDTATTTDVSLGAKSIAHRRRRALLAALLAGLSLAIGASLFLGPFHKFRLAGPNDWPRLSLVILPFENLIRSYQDGLRLAGERDHADEDADFGVPTDGVRHGDIAGFTPKGAPGVKMIRTAELSWFLVEARPILIDTLSYSWGRSIPGAVGLKFAGLGGSFTDAAQDHLRSKMRDLTSGDLNRPIVAVGWNSERFDGRNLALRLAALGYTQVHWYRGGREAWEVDGLPETEPDVQE
jgi:DNA-binding winged helix-turn-helix (wHTH) protein